MSQNPDPQRDLGPHGDFGERLGRLVPGTPDTAGWAERARAASQRRRDRRRVLGASLGAAAVLVVGVVTTTQLGLGERTLPAGPAGSATASSSQPSASASTPAAIDPVPVDPVPIDPVPIDEGTGCPSDQTGFVDPPPAVTLATGATSLRWCTWDDATQVMGEWAPPEPLTTDLDRWVLAFNALAPVPPDQACTSDWSLPAAAVLTYPDGSRQVVGGMRAGCGTIGGRVGFEQVRTLTIEMFRQQRGDDFVPPQVSFTPCRYSASTIPALLDRVTSGATCSVREDGTPLSAAVPASQVAAIRDDLIERRTRWSDYPMLDGPQLQLYQANGEMVVLTASSYEPGAWFWQDEDQSWWVWRPRTEVRGVLDQTLARMGPAQPSR